MNMAAVLRVPRTDVLRSKLDRCHRPLRRSGALLLFAFLALSLDGCSRPIIDFAFESNGKTVRLQADRYVVAGKQGAFLAASSRTADAVRTTALFTLVKPQRVNAKGIDFYLTYSASRGPMELRLVESRAEGDRRIESSVLLPIPGPGSKERSAVKRASPGASEQQAGQPPVSSSRSAAGSASGSTAVVRYLLPVAEGSKILAFRVTTSSPKAEIRIRSAGLTNDERGVQFGAGLTSIRAGFTVAVTTPSAGDAVTTVHFPNLGSRLDGAQAQLVLTYTYEAAPGEVHLSATGSSGRSKRYFVNLRPGTHHLYLYTASCGFTPDALTISSNSPGFKVDSLFLHRFLTPPVPAGQVGSTAPIPADLGAMLAYNPKWWRQKDYELFSWSLIPSVIVMEFRSYSVQARYMKRIAYFVEKEGYAGRLWTNAQLAGLIGWNAHDYRPRDLARFFTLAAKEHFALNSEEKHLETILLANGVVRREGGSYGAGKGAILTFAHVGSYWLRSLLLTHESFHGIFFTHPDYRRAVLSIWNHTSRDEQELFRNVFLAYEGYDIGDIYLVRNEFQAYLMEQPVAATQSYFDAALTHRMKRMSVGDASPLRRYFEAHPEMFRRSAEEVQRAVEKAAGVKAGEDVGLVPD